MKRMIMLVLCLMIALSLAGCGRKMPASIQANENEIKLIIGLDLKEEIGLFLVESDIGGQKSVGGTSNADRTMIKPDDVIYWSLDKQHYENVSDTVELTLNFTAVTEYFNPNYDNDYPEEYKIPMDGITFTASFGEVYSIRITGDKANGYQAVLEQGVSKTE